MKLDGNLQSMIMRTVSDKLFNPLIEERKKPIVEEIMRTKLFAGDIPASKIPAKYRKYIRTSNEAKVVMRHSIHHFVKLPISFAVPLGEVKEYIVNDKNREAYEAIILGKSQFESKLYTVLNNISNTDELKKTFPYLMDILQSHIDGINAQLKP